MPNTPALVDEGMAAIAPGPTCDDSHAAEATRLLSSVGRVVTVPEAYLDAVTALSGSGPAYIFYVVEAMIEAGVLLGLPRECPPTWWCRPWSARRPCCGKPASTPRCFVRTSVPRPAPPSRRFENSTGTWCGQPSFRDRGRPRPVRRTRGRSMTRHAGGPR